MKTVKLEIPIYGGHLKLCFVKRKNADKEVMKHFNFDMKGFSSLCSTKTDDEGVMSFALIFVKEDITPGIIAHECKHLVNKVFHRAGVWLDTENDETECYFLSWCVNRVHENCKIVTN